MVVFTCNHCGDSLHKPKVEKHYQTSCRNGKNLTCVDCFKDFKGEEYVVHIKCFTEDERYAAKGSMVMGTPKKGETKQQCWMDMVNSIIEKEPDMNAPMKNMLNIIAGYVNVPRKKAKFINFVTNSFGRSYNRNHIEQIWDLIEKHKNVQFPKKQQEVQAATQATNGNETSKRKAEEKEDVDPEVPVKKKKSKKDNNCENEDTNGTNGTENGTNGKTDETNGDVDDKFSFEDKILEILNAKKQLSTKKLQKKVLSAYIKHKDLEEFTEKHVKKYNKRLKKMPQIEIKDDSVVLL